MQKIDDHVKRPSISCTGLKLRKNVSAHLHVKLQNTSCQRISIYMVDDMGTPEETFDDLIYEVEFDACIPQRVITSGYIRSETILETLEQYDHYRNSQTSVDEDPRALVAIIEGCISAFTAKHAQLEIDQRLIDGNNEEVVVVTLQIGCFETFAQMNLDEAQRFFEIKEEHFGDAIIGEPTEWPIVEIDEKEINLA